MSDIIELKDEELEKVSGGWSQNEDGTYNIYEGETFVQGDYSFNVLETKLNATLDSCIKCEFINNYGDNGKAVDFGVSNFEISRILFGYIGIAPTSVYTTNGGTK